MAEAEVEAAEGAEVGVEVVVVVAAEAVVAEEDGLVADSASLLLSKIHSVCRALCQQKRLF